MARKVDIGYGANLDDLMNTAKKALVTSPDYTGIGGHGTQDHGGHGKHSQLSIGVEGATINFRRDEMAGGG